MQLVLEKLDTLIRIQALQAVSHFETKTQKVIFLHEAGFQPKEISGIVGGESGTVRQVIYTQKQKGKAK